MVSSWPADAPWMIGLGGYYHRACWAAYSELRAGRIDEARREVQLVMETARMLVATGQVEQLAKKVNAATRERSDRREHPW